MLHQSVKPVRTALIELVGVKDPILIAPGEVTQRGSSSAKSMKTHTIIRLSPDFSKRIAEALAKGFPEITQPIQPGHAGDRSTGYVNRMREFYRVMHGDDPHRWYTRAGLPGIYARDQGLPPKTIQVDVVHGGVIYRNKPYSQYAFDELIRSIEHAEAQR